jgi:hypothetical protein
VKEGVVAAIVSIWKQYGTNTQRSRGRTRWRNLRMRDARKSSARPTWQNTRMPPRTRYVPVGGKAPSLELKRVEIALANFAGHNAPCGGGPPSDRASITWRTRVCSETIRSDCRGVCVGSLRQSRQFLTANSTSRSRRRRGVVHGVLRVGTRLGDQDQQTINQAAQVYKTRPMRMSWWSATPTRWAGRHEHAAVRSPRQRGQGRPDRCRRRRAS